jgi:hypothetical protein
MIELAKQLGIGVKVFTRLSISGFRHVGETVDRAILQRVAESTQNHL